MGTQSPSPMSPASASFSDSSDEDNASIPSALGPSASRRGSLSTPLRAETSNGGTVDDDSVTCVWDNCGVVYTHLRTLIDHIHNGEFLFACRR
jgi:hypothetical protein